jgi:hypothetical protein
VNQQRAKLGYQPFKPSHKFSAKTVQPKEETKNAQKEMLLEHIKLSVAQLRGRAPAKKAPKPASSNKLEREGIYPISLEINKRKFTYNFHIFNNLNEDIILGINFFQEHRLGYDPTSQKLHWTDCSTPNWSTASLQCSQQITINPTSNKLVTLNVITESLCINVLLNSSIYVLSCQP